MSSNSHPRAQAVQQPNVRYVGPQELPTAKILSYSSLEIVDRKFFNSPSLLNISANSHLRAQAVQQPNVGYVSPYEWRTASILSYSSFEIVDRKGFNSPSSLNMSADSHPRAQAV
jgi:hypothetical protein